MPFFDPIRIGASGAADTTYTVDRSLRFEESDTTYLEASPTFNTKKYTFSFWFKPVKKGGGAILSYNMVGNNRQSFSYDEYEGHFANQLRVSGSTKSQYATSAAFRDFSAWYHVVYVWDTDNSTQDDRFIVYVNNVRQAMTQYTGTVSGQTGYIGGGNTINIGKSTDGYSKGSYYLAEFHLIDGQAYDPSYFAETDATTGQWNPKAYVGSYGSGGFFLEFKDTSNLGLDTSGNSNNWTANNFSVAAGTGNDSMKDTPTNNFATFNSALPTGSSSSYSNGNLQFEASVSDFRQTRSTFAHDSGKWYAEFKLESFSHAHGSYPYIGVAAANTFEQTWVGEIGTAVNRIGTAYINGSSTSGGFSFTTGDIIGMALDVDNLLLYFYKNGTIQNSGTGFAITANTNKGYQFAISIWATAVWTANFGGIGIGSYSDANGHGNFTYSVPSGYLAECSANLTEPSILLPDKHFDTLIYTGDGGTQTITGLQYRPDWVWIKRRNASTSSRLLDTVRGSDKRLISNLSDSEVTHNYMPSFNSDGFTLTGGHTPYNKSGSTYVAWNWNAGETDGKTYTVTVVSDSGNKYRFDGFGTSAVTLDLAEGGTYIFNYPSGHPFRFSTTSDGTHGGGSEYTTGVTHNSSTQVTIVVAASAPTLYYYCSSHSGMGGQVNTNSTLGSSNFDGNLQSVTKVNATSGFSIVKWTSGANAYKTVGHGLGVKPQVVIIKRRDATGNWFVFYDVVDGTNDYLQLNSTTTALNAESYSIVPPTSTVFGTDGAFVGGNTNATMIAYVFSSVAGYSKFGSYVGNGSSSDGMFVHTGFRPAWVMWKATGLSSNWVILDSARDTQNVTENVIQANESSAENTTMGDSDFLSNGFKLRTTVNNDTNVNNQTYIYLAFSESPFKNARAR